LTVKLAFLFFVHKDNKKNKWLLIFRIRPWGDEGDNQITGIKKVKAK